MALVLWFLLRHPLMWLHSQFTNQALAWIADSPAERANVVLSDGEFVVVTGLVSENGFPLARRIPDVYVPSFNLVLFVTLLIGVPFHFVRRSWKYLLVAAGILLLTQSLFYTSRVLFSVVDIYAENGQRYLSDAVVGAIRLPWRTWGIALADAIPFVLFLPVFLRREAPRGDRAARPHRNASCPCGSGKKFKHCCGAP